MPRMQPDVLEAFLKEPHVGVIATLRQDGRPYTVPVWWLWKEPHFWITGTYSRIWCRQIMQDSRVSLCIEAGAPVSGHVEVDGDAFPVELPRLRHLARFARTCRKVRRPRRPGSQTPTSSASSPTCRRNRGSSFASNRPYWRAIDMRVYQGKRPPRIREFHGGPSTGRRLTASGRALPYDSLHIVARP